MPHPAPARPVHPRAVVVLGVPLTGAEVVAPLLQYGFPGVVIALLLMGYLVPSSVTKVLQERIQKLQEEKDESEKFVTERLWSMSTSYAELTKGLSEAIVRSTDISEETRVALDRVNKSHDEWIGLMGVVRDGLLQQEARNGRPRIQDRARVRD